jgi:hypothetical protein
MLEEDWDKLSEDEVAVLELAFATKEMPYAYDSSLK